MPRQRRSPATRKTDSSSTAALAYRLDRTDPNVIAGTPAAYNGTPGVDVDGQQDAKAIHDAQERQGRIIVGRLCLRQLLLTMGSIVRIQMSLPFARMLGRSQGSMFSASSTSLRTRPYGIQRHCRRRSRRQHHRHASCVRLAAPYAHGPC